MSRNIAAVDRSKTCPFLLRCFYSINRSRSVQDYRGHLPSEEVQIYTWKDATLKEIVELLQDCLEKARHPEALFKFKLVFPDKEGNNIMNPTGRVFNRKSTPDDNKTLESLRFQIGDYLDIEISLR